VWVEVRWVYPCSDQVGDSRRERDDGREHPLFESSVLRGGIETNLQRIGGRPLAVRAGRLWSSQR
jgi:hypothetical protein